MPSINPIVLHHFPTSPWGPHGGAFGRGAQAQWPHHRRTHRAGADLPQATSQGVVTTELEFLGTKMGISARKSWILAGMVNI